MTLTFPETLHISIIIPALNEEHHLPGLLTRLKRHEGLEVIVADGGSTDRTLEIASRFNARIIKALPGRGSQQNAGARAASHDILMFLHCDTKLPENFPATVCNVLNQDNTAAGSFRLKINAHEHVFRLVEWGANLRSRLFGLPYGDQALFMKKKLFDKAGGFPDQPLLEDLAIVRKLKQIGKIRIAPESVVTSARRWRQKGVMRTTVINQLILLGFLCGIDPAKLARLYNDPISKD